MRVSARVTQGEAGSPTAGHPGRDTALHAGFLSCGMPSWIRVAKIALVLVWAGSGAFLNYARTVPFTIRARVVAVLWLVTGTAGGALLLHLARNTSPCGCAT